MNPIVNPLRLACGDFDVLMSRTQGDIQQVWDRVGVPGPFLFTEQNGLSKTGECLAVRGHYALYVIDGVEYASGDWTWTCYAGVDTARNLYGRQAADPGATVETITSVATPYLDLGGGRILERLENLYYPAQDGGGLMHRVAVVIGKTSAAADNISSLTVAQYLSLANPVQERQTTWRGLLALGDSGWSADAGVTLSAARLSVHPNLLPDFDDAGWQLTGTGVKLSAAQYQLDPGAYLRIWLKQPLPEDRDLSVGGTGTARVRVGVNRKLNSIEHDLEIAASGTWSGVLNAGFGNHALFVEIRNTGASAQTVSDLWIRSAPLGYTAPDGSLLGNDRRGWSTPMRVTGSGLAGKRLYFDGAFDLSRSEALALWLLPMNTARSQPGFRFFVRSGGEYHTSQANDIWVDWNERYSNQPSQENYWDDGFHFEPVPGGITQSDRVGIEILTDDAIDWLLGDFLVLATADLPGMGPGCEQRYRHGLQGRQQRQQDASLGQYLQAALNPSALVTDRVGIVVGINQSGSQYVEKSFLSLAGPSVSPPTLGDVYQWEQLHVDTTWAALADAGATASYVLPADALVPDTCTNQATGDTLTVRRWDPATRTVTLDVATDAPASTGDAVRLRYLRKKLLAASNYTLVQHLTGQWQIEWNDATMVAKAGQSYLVEYAWPEGAACSVYGLTVLADRQCQRVVADARNYDTSAPYTAVHAKLFLSADSNTRAQGTFCYRFHRDPADLDALADAAYTIFAGATTNTRVEAHDPALRNWSIMPHASYGGEFVADDPAYVLDAFADRFAEGHIGNCIMSGGSLSAVKARLRAAWYGWANALADSGISYIDATRDVIRRGYGDEVIAENIGAHRYLVELTVFNARWLVKHRDHCAVGTTGAERLRRYWYYEAADATQYLSAARAVDDMDPGYYAPVVQGGKTYTFQYHYVGAYANLWSTLRPGSGNVVTLHDLWLKVAETYLAEYDCDGVILSELIGTYLWTYASQDLACYNEWRAAHSLPTLSDWVRDGNGRAVADDATLWDWKCWEVEEAMKRVTALARSHGKLAGMNLEVDSIIGVQNKDAAVWDGMTKAQAYDGSWHVRELTHNCKRYGMDYDALFKAGVADLGYVWLYHRYAPQAWWENDPSLVDDFIAAYGRYRERLIVGVGLYPSGNLPASAAEMQRLLGKLIDAGFNVAYPGWPRIITSETFDEMWAWFREYMPSITVNLDAPDVVRIDPARYGGIPFTVV